MRTIRQMVWGLGLVAMLLAGGCYAGPPCGGYPPPCGYPQPPPCGGGGPVYIVPPPPQQRPLYTCPQHPDFQSPQPGKCSICGTDLVPR